MDENLKNSPKIGEIYLCLDELALDIYYEVVFLQKMIHTTGETFITLKGVLKPTVELTWPVLFFDKKFVKVNETTVKILFGKGAKNGNTSNSKKS